MPRINRSSSSKTEREPTKSRRGSTLWQLWLPVAVVVLTLAAFAYVRLSKREFLEFKTAYETTATVRRKEHVILDEDKRPPMEVSNDQMTPPRSEQWRVYYQIDNFNNLPEHLLNRVAKAEEERLATLGVRFTHNSKEWYDKVELDDKLEATYRVRESGEIEIISVTNPKYPSLH
jgi:hypothetical protein